MTIVSVISQSFDKYCLESLNPAFAHVWVCLIPSSLSLLIVSKAVVLTAMGVTIAMYCLIQFYYQLKEDLAEHRPFLKLLSIKLVIFLAFWQTVSVFRNHISKHTNTSRSLLISSPPPTSSNLAQLSSNQISKSEFLRCFCV